MSLTFRKKCREFFTKKHKNLYRIIEDYLSEEPSKVYDLIDIIETGIQESPDYFERDLYPHVCLIFFNGPSSADLSVPIFQDAMLKWYAEFEIETRLKTAYFEDRSIANKEEKSSI